MHRRWWKNGSLISRCGALAALVLLASVPAFGQGAPPATPPPPPVPQAPNAAQQSVAVTTVPTVSGLAVLLVLTDPEVSRHHARVVVADGRLVVEDLGRTTMRVI